MSCMLSLAIFLACSFQLSSTVCTDLPIRLPGKVVVPSSDSSQPTCPSDSERQSILDELNTDLDGIIDAQLEIFQRLSFPVECPGDGWVKVFDLNLETNSEDPCPNSWIKTTVNGILHCRLPQGGSECQNETVSTNSLSYSRVCGRLKGFQYGRTSAFFPYSSIAGSGVGINGVYLDGVSITRGTPREHIWSFASGYSSIEGLVGFQCPCISESLVGVTPPPDFVGNNYFCDSGTDTEPASGQFYGSNPLWDGQGCQAGNQCCSRGPYFFAELPEASCDPLEVRLCVYNTATINVGLSIMELYVK